MKKRYNGKTYPNGTVFHLPNGNTVTIRSQSGDEQYEKAMDYLSYRCDGFLDTTDLLDGRGKWHYWKDTYKWKVILPEPEYNVFN